MNDIDDDPVQALTQLAAGLTFDAIPGVVAAIVIAAVSHFGEQEASRPACRPMPRRRSSPMDCQGKVGPLPVTLTASGGGRRNAATWGCHPRSGRWPRPRSSSTPPAACRHTHPAADALLQVLNAPHHLTAGDLRPVTALVHQAAIDLLGPFTNPQTVHQAKFSMGTVLGLVAVSA